MKNLTFANSTETLNSSTAITGALTNSTQRFSFSVIHHHRLPFPPLLPTTGSNFYWIPALLLLGLTSAAAFVWVMRNHSTRLQTGVNYCKERIAHTFYGARRDEAYEEISDADAMHQLHAHSP